MRSPPRRFLSPPKHALRGAGLLLLIGLAHDKANAAVLFEDNFDRGIPGWRAVQSDAEYLDGPLRWQYDIVSGCYVETSNLYTDSASYSASATAPMLINDTVTGTSFTYSARLTAGDDDGFGLIFGYQDDANFYRVAFGRQARTGFPWTGWALDRKVNGVTANLLGAGTAGYLQTFVNTAARPFDVTITVSSSGRLTLTVVDDPAGTATTYTLVANQPLPASAAGQVGLMTWGMSGSTPRGFRIGSLSLSPAGLSGNPNLLADWTPVVPPRSNGSTTLSGGNLQPLWALGVDAGGPCGTVAESSDCYGGNDAAAQVDFTGPALVAGADIWTNYTVAARLIPGDDDGQGILLRYKNATNFCRIVLRAQSASGGPPQGLSIQKSVNRTYSEIYRETTPQYLPLTGVPYDLVAAVSNNTLSVLLVADPDGAAQPYTYGPFNVTSVASGRIGLFSWGMTLAEFDSVSVQDETPLYVMSPFGTPTPAKGLRSFASGASVSASSGPGVEAGGIRRIPNGWTGTGSVPASGSGSNVVFTLDAFSRLQWLWRTEYQLSVIHGPGGTVQGPAGWLRDGTNVTLMAQPAPGFVFDKWVGDYPTFTATLSLTMNQSYTVAAVFSADGDGDGLSDEWEQFRFGSLAAAPAGDPDADGSTNLDEYRNGTNLLINETNPVVSDELLITHLRVTNNAVLTVSNNLGTRYNVEWATNVSGPWSLRAGRQAGNTFSSALPAGNRGFWRLQQPARPVTVPAFVPGSWTIAVLPDPQVYSQSYPDLFQDQTRWIAANKHRFNIKYVLLLGDLTNNNTSNQWDNASAALSLLDGVVPYALVGGNHDYGENGNSRNRETYMNSYFPFSRFLASRVTDGVMEPGKVDNSYHLFSAGGVDWLILALEFGPRNSTVTWANSIVNLYPNRRAILVTHAYLYHDDTRYDWATKGTTQSWNPHAYPIATDPDGVNDGEELWQKLIKIHSTFVMVFNGHVIGDGLGRLSSTGDSGNVVHQMLSNYQMQPLGGEAYLRLVEFRPDGTNVQVKTFSPLYGTYKTDAQNQFIFTLQPPLH